MLAPTQTSIHGHLATLPLFADCSPDQLQRLAGRASVEFCPKGKMLFIAGEPAQACYILLNGWVKLYRETLDGTQAIIDILPAGFLFGETALYEDKSYPFSAEIVEAATIICLPLSVLEQEMQRDLKLAFMMLRSMARQRRQQDMEIEHTKVQNAPQRIACFLLRLCNQKEEGPITLHLPYDKTLLASRLGMQPETFSRALNRLRDDTGLTIKGGSIEIPAIKTLTKYVCASCSFTFPCKDREI
jgi:CRP-like cAMP-binding protein